MIMKRYISFKKKNSPQATCIKYIARTDFNEAKTHRYDRGNLQKSKVKSANHAEADNSPAGLNNHLVVDTTTGIPCQVSETVHAVVGEGKSEDALEADLCGRRETSESSSQRGRLEVPAEQGSSEVGGCEEVQGARQDDSSDSVKTAEIPRNLGSVDGKVGRNRTSQTLLGEELSGIGGSRTGSVVSCRIVSTRPFTLKLLRFLGSRWDMDA